jgi:hypothetical protein
VWFLFYFSKPLGYSSSEVDLTTSVTHAAQALGGKCVQIDNIAKYQILSPEIPKARKTWGHLFKEKGFSR